MIEIDKLTHADIGREVVYTAHYKREYGRITSWNDKFIFVRYHTIIYNDGEQRARTGETSESTHEKDLNFV